MANKLVSMDPSAKRTDRIFGGLVALASLAFLALAVPAISGDWQRGTEASYYTVGPRFFPYLAGGLCLLLSILVLLKPDGMNNLSGLKESLARRRVLIALGIALCYTAALSLFGFVPASIAGLLLFFLIFGERRWFLILPLAVGMPLLIRYVFTHFFYLDLPEGLWALPI